MAALRRHAGARDRERVREGSLRAMAAGDGSLRFRDAARGGRNQGWTRRSPRGTRAAHLPPRRPRAGCPARDGPAELPARARRQTTAMSDQLKIRRLTYADLPQVIAIERRAFPTPWSLAMFVLELSKPTGICLAAIARRARGRLPGLLALRPRLARDERRRGRPPAAPGHRHGAAQRACSRSPTGRASSTRSRCASPTTARSRLYERFGFKSAGLRPGYYHDNKEDAVIMWRTAESGEAVEETAEGARPAHA